MLQYVSLSLRTPNALYICFKNTTAHSHDSTTTTKAKLSDPHKLFLHLCFLQSPLSKPECLMTKRVIVSVTRVQVSTASPPHLGEGKPRRSPDTPLPPLIPHTHTPPLHAPALLHVAGRNAMSEMDKGRAKSREARNRMKIKSQGGFQGICSI